MRAEADAVCGRRLTTLRSCCWRCLLQALAGAGPPTGLQGCTWLLQVDLYKTSLEASPLQLQVGLSVTTVPCTLVSLHLQPLLQGLPLQQQRARGAAHADHSLKGVACTCAKSNDQLC